MKYKLVALDVDGTLLNDDHMLTEKTKRIISKVRNTGGTVVLCTGRGPTNTLPVLEQLGFEGTIITHNGAATVDSTERKILHSYPFDINEVSRLIEYCRMKVVHFDVCTAFKMYLEKIDDEQKKMYQKFMLHPKLVADVQKLDRCIVKFTVYDKPEVVDLVEKDWTNINMSLHMIRSGDRFIDVMHQEATKGNALRQLANLLKVDRSQIIAIGNYYNDIEMIKFAGMGIAMENAPQAVKETADDITASNNEDGVYAALEKHYFDL
jgi:Cof subfamily protein (haloacid dehalogenase superfamily)